MIWGSGGYSTIHAPIFDLKRTIESGQAFYWTDSGDASATGAPRYRGLIGEVAVSLEQHGDTLRVTPGTEEIVRHYFALDHSLEEIYATFPDDPAMKAALDYCRGVRVMRQPLWECLATFITSAMKQVKHIQQMSRALRERYGREIPSVGGALFAYPDPERLANLAEADFRECGLGFRAKNLLGTARMVAGGEIDLEAIRSLPDGDALEELCRLPGVGPKIANCTLLFAYERVKAFPIDVWIERVLRQRYFPKKRVVTSQHLKEFASTYFGSYGGYAQQYLFHHARNQPRSVWKLDERDKIKVAQSGS